MASPGPGPGPGPAPGTTSSPTGTGSAEPGYSVAYLDADTVTFVCAVTH